MSIFSRVLFGLAFVVCFISLNTVSFSATCTPGTPLTVAPGGTQTQGTITVYSSTEEPDGTSAALDVIARSNVSLQDDSWRAASSSSGLTNFSTPWVGTTTGSISNTPYTLFSLGTVTVQSQLRNMVGLDTSGECNGSTIGSASIDINGTLTMQDESPFPSILYGATSGFWNEGGGANNSRNAVVFTFSAPVKAFGAWFGDLETRTDGSANGGRPAIIRLLDASGNRIGEDVKIQGAVETDEGCGGDDPTRSASACGNESTRWIGFVDSSSNSFAPVPAVVSSMVVIVGDDDDIAATLPDCVPNTNPGCTSVITNTDGNTEHLSFVGATLATLAPTAADASISGRVVSPMGRALRTSVNIALTSQDGNTIYTRTNQLGYFNFKNVETGQTYIINAYSKRYQFNSQVITVDDNVNGVIITAQ